MKTLRRILPRCAAVFFLGAGITLPLSGLPRADARHPSRDDAYTFHGSTGALHTFALQGGRYVLDVYAGFLAVATPGTSTCSFSAVLNGVEHPVPGGLSTLGAGPVGSFGPYRYIPTLNLPAGHYTLAVSPITDCDWSVSIGGGGTGSPFLEFGDTGIYHVLAGGNAKTTIVETTGKSYSFGFAYNAWGDGFAAPTATLTMLRGGRVLHTYTLAAAFGSYVQSSFVTALTFPHGSGDPPGSYVARYSLSLGGKTVTKDVPYTLQNLAAGHWVPQTSPTANDLGDVTCPTTSHCVISGNKATVVLTNDGHTWTRRGTPLDRRDFINLNGVACPTVRRCYAVGDLYFILGSTDGGKTWVTQNGDYSFTSYAQNYIAVTCPSEQRCYAVGTGGIMATTTDGGAHWKGLASFGTGKDLADVACPTETSCYVVGRDGVIKRTTDGGATWQRRTVDVPYLFSVSCPTARRCYATGEQGTIVVTTDGGNTWTRQNNPLTGSTVWIDSVACSTASICHAVAQDGALLLTTDGGRSWRDQPSPTDKQLNVVVCPGAGTCYAIGSAGTIIEGA